MKINGLQSTWMVFVGCLLLLIITLLVWRARQLPPNYSTRDVSVEMFWTEFPSDKLMWDDYEARTLVENLRRETGWAMPPTCSIRNEVISAFGASGRRLYLISMSQVQYAAFRGSAMNNDGQQIAPPQNPDCAPLWWNPPKVESLILNHGLSIATYDSNRTLLFLRTRRRKNSACKWARRVRMTDF